MIIMMTDNDNDDDENDNDDCDDDYEYFSTRDQHFCCQWADLYNANVALVFSSFTFSLCLLLDFS